MRSGATPGRAAQASGRRFGRRLATTLVLLLAAGGVVAVEISSCRSAAAQEQVDVLDRPRQAAAAIARMTMRVRVVRLAPEADAFWIEWRRGGEGLGGSVVRGRFAPPGAKAPDVDAKLDAGPRPTFAVNQWSDWTPVETVCGRAKGFEFPSVTVAYVAAPKQKTPEPPAAVDVEFEFAERGETFRRFVERAPRGATVGFAFPASLLDERGAQNAEFAASLQGLAGHARARRERLERLFPEPVAPPARFALLGHLAGYGQGPGGGLGKAVGFGVRHNNPDIVADECRTLRLLGVNGLVDEKSVRMAELAGVADDFRQIYWGGPGSGSPMAAVSSSGAGEPDGCPFDPRLERTMGEAIERALAQHEASGAREKWGLWWDEIGVAAKAHLNDCPRCREQFRDYVRGQSVAPRDLGADDWDGVAPYPLWTVEKSSGAGKSAKQTLAAAPDDAAQRLRYYYTYRFMTFATGRLFPDAAKRLDAVGVRLYAMQGPTPSWNGSSLDWHEFYDTGANTALVFETSNRDPRAWPWESYLSDILRGVSRRHGDLPIGCLVKPHRGAPAQRMLSVVSRGARALEWYTYGPDYAKGDSFSQSPELLEEVARAGRFLARAEPHLWNARFLDEPATAFVLPRSSEIWDRFAPAGPTALENAKWVYLALRHAHVPVDILSEQQLAEGIPARYRTLYVVGPNLRRDATEKTAEWVRNGGTLWTDAGGLGRDERNEPNVAGRALVAAGERTVATWGRCPEYRATRLEPLVEADPPEFAAWKFVASPRRAQPDATAEAAGSRAHLAREILAADGARVLAAFADGKPAATERVVGKGRVVTLGFLAGVSYSARVRRADYDMHADFDPALRELVTSAALDAGISRTAVPSDPQVEAVALVNEHGRCVTLVNWSHVADRAHPRGARLQPVENLRIRIAPPGGPAPGGVRSLRHDRRFPVTEGVVTLPKLDDIDVLAFE